MRAKGAEILPSRLGTSHIISMFSFTTEKDNNKLYN